jgi:hypothetical protein
VAILTGILIDHPEISMLELPLIVGQNVFGEGKPNPFAKTQRSLKRRRANGS